MESGLWLMKSAANRCSRILLDIECQEGQIENQRHPVTIDQKQECQKAMDRCFRDDVGIETVAKIDWINVIAADSLVKFRR